MRALHAILAGALALLASWGGCSASAGAEPAAPRRAHERSTRLAPGTRTAPDITGSIRHPAPVEAKPPHSPAVEAPVGPPFRLPTASRARIRSCGEAWQAKKASGQAGTDTWRDFALVCLAVRDPAGAPQR